MKKRITLLTCLLIVVLTILTGHARASSFDWKTYESEHFILFYQPGYEWQAQQTIYYLEQHLPKVSKLTGNPNLGKIKIVLQDVGIDSNGWADSWQNKVSIFNNSPTTGGTLSSAQNWFRFVSGHELTHLAQLNNYSGAGAILPMIFGNFFSPNDHVPQWLVEGITVYYESSLNPYEGRLNDGYYDAIVATKAQAKDLPSILEAAYDHAHYPLGQWYTYGSVFMRHLAQTYGEEKIAEFFQTHGQHPLGFIGSITPDLGVDLAARKVFGRTLAQLYDEWIIAEQTEHQNWKIDGRLVREEQNRGYYANLTIYNGKLYYTHTRLHTPEPFSYGGTFELVEYDPTTNTEKVLTHLASLSGVKMQIVNDKVYYLCGETASGYANTENLGSGLTGILYSYNLVTGALTRVFSAPVEAFTVLKDDTILYTTERKDAYGAEIWKYAGKAHAKVGVIDQMVAEILPYDDHFIVVSKVNLGSWNVNHFNLADLSFTPIVNTPWMESGIALYGKNLYFTANYQHESALYTYDLTTGAVSKLTSGGYAYGGVPLGDEIFFEAMTTKGDAIFKKALLPTPYTIGEHEIIDRTPYTEFVTTLTEGSAPLTNWASMLVPYQRLIPTLAEGADALGLTSYSIGYSPFGGLDVTLNTAELMPLWITVKNTIVNVNKERSTDLTLSYPLYQSAQFGLQSVNLMGYTDFEQFGGSVDAAIKMPGQNLHLRVAHDTTGFSFADASYLLSMGQSSVRLNGVLAFQKLPDTIDYMYGLNADYTRKLAELREGFWHSTIYVSDVYGNIHFDYSNLSDCLINANIQLEASMGFILATVPKVGVTYSVQKQEFRPYFEFNIGF